MKTLKLALVGCLSLTALSTAVAQIQEAPAATTQSQNQDSSIIRKLFEEKPWIRQQWDKAQISVDAPYTLSGDGLDLSFKFARTVQPAFIQGAQQLLDTWAVNLASNTGALGLTTGALTGNADIGAQVTFSRIFDTKGEAIISKPYTFWQNVPWTHQQAIKLLKSGEAVRVELFLDLGASTGVGSTVGKFGNGSLGPNYTRGVRFLVDIYKLKNERVRMRVVSQRNGGTFSISGGINLLSGADLGTGLVRNFLKLFIDDCNIVNGQGNLADVNDPPVDTEMYDYIFNLNNPEAQQAYDLVMEAIGSFNYKEVIDPLLILKGHDAYSEKISEQLQEALRPAERAYQLDKGNIQSQRNVDRWFRGVTRTAINGHVFGSSCMKAWDLSYNDSVSKTLVKNYDRDDRLTAQVYENAAAIGKRSYGFGNWETITRNSINTLFHATIINNKSFEETALSDLIVSFDQRNKDFAPSRYQEIKANLKYILPPQTFAAIDWGLFDKTADIKKNNVSYHYDLIFHKEALLAINGLSETQIQESLLAYAKAFPDSNWLDISMDQPAPPGRNHSAAGGSYVPPLAQRFDYDVSIVARPLSIILSKDPKYTAAQKAREFEKVRNNVLFRQIGAGYMISLLPQERAESLVAFRINLAGPNGMSIAKSIGASGESKTYTSVEYILKLLSDRSFDLRLQVDATGTITPMSQKVDTSAVPLQ